MGGSTVSLSIINSSYHVLLVVLCVRKVAYIVRAQRLVQPHLHVLELQERDAVVVDKDCNQYKHVKDLVRLELREKRGLGSFVIVVKSFYKES